MRSEHSLTRLWVSLYACLIMVTTIKNVWLSTGMLVMATACLVTILILDRKDKE